MKSEQYACAYAPCLEGEEALFHVLLSSALGGGKWLFCTAHLIHRSCAILSFLLSLF